MIKDLMGLIGFILKTIFKGLKYVLFGISWYVKTLSDILKDYPKKNAKKITIKEEIL